MYFQFDLQYLQTLTDFSGHHSNGNNGSAKESDSSNMAVANSSFFSLTEEDDLILPSPQHSPVKEPDLGRGASPGPRSRRLSSGSMISEAANLFPIYESTPQVITTSQVSLQTIKSFFCSVNFILFYASHFKMFISLIVLSFFLFRPRTSTRPPAASGKPTTTLVPRHTCRPSQRSNFFRCFKNLGSLEIKLYQPC